MPTLALVAQLQAQLDDEIGRVLADCSGQAIPLYCRRGCANCCRLAVHATWPEAQALAATLSRTQTERLSVHVARLRLEGAGDDSLVAYLRRHRDTLDGCPFLDADGACGVYAQRPLSCRALLSTRPADWCGLDLSTLPAIDKSLYLSSLDPELVDVPTHFLKQTRAMGQAGEAELLAAMSGLYGFSLIGNLALLVWLASMTTLPAVLAVGFPAVDAVLKELDLPPWMVQLGA